MYYRSVSAEVVLYPSKKMTSDAFLKIICMFIVVRISKDFCVLQVLFAYVKIVQSLFSLFYEEYLNENK